MSRITILGAGAFGTALSVALSQKQPVRLWGRGLTARESPRLPGVVLPDAVDLCPDLPVAQPGDTILLAVPMQALHGFLRQTAQSFSGCHVVACCKGIDLATGFGPAQTVARACPDAVPAILTGPSFATDIAAGLPTALTISCADPMAADHLRDMLATPTLRLYSTTDVIGAELGGALKNVIAIAAGMAIGAKLGPSARAAVMTRGFAEMLRMAVHLGARAETMAGLSGLGDLVLSCTSDGSRNFSHGLALGRGSPTSPDGTVEGIATAQAVRSLAQLHGIDMPLSAMVADLTQNRISLGDAVQALLARPLKQE